MRLMSMRFRICLLLLAGISASVCMRSHFSMTLVCMLKKAVSNSTATSSTLGEVSDGCPIYEVESDGGKVETETGELEWPRERTPYLFTVVLLGQVVSLVISMHLSNRVSPSKMMLFAVLSQVLITFISPTLARISYWTFFVARFAMGMAEGLIFSPISALATRWFPPNERASMSALYTSAFQIAFGIAPFVVSFICSSSLGWPSSFYLFGIFGIVWAMEWLRVGADDPSCSKHISEKEKTKLAKFQSNGQKNTVIRPPYGEMFTSPVLFAHIAAMIAFYFTLGIMSSFLPTFFEERLRLPIRKNGLFTMIPFLAQIFSKNGLAFGLDFLKKRGRIGHTAAAKIAQTIGCVGASVSLLVLLHFADCTQPEVALVAMTLCCALHSCMAVGFYASMLHICPPLTGVIASIVTASGVIASGLSTAMMGVASKYSHKYELIFGLCITLNIFAGLIYLAWGTAEVQPWAGHVNPVVRKEDKLMGDEEEGGESEEIPPCPLEALT
ncbi:hypothetical protein PMAYCL1PPCAC_02195 [Pristionchus mayeri]|uniref:Major facilitator superfamily (MFS) profile domain-containing protein n=1 Tax=Pristionchus mayeri TaxID=1317129 RepID=A0AAN5C615_9BILA|nr:hypothetical protein PMAYCL1PPCAC_02195 [Pristionchus mayeri]